MDYVPYMKEILLQKLLSGDEVWNAQRASFLVLDVACADANVFGCVRSTLMKSLTCWIRVRSVAKT